MKTPRTTFALIGLFFAGLLVLWWLDYAGVPTERERLARQNRILPDLVDAPEASLARVEVARGEEKLVFERRGANRWQMTRPTDVAADPSALETLARNLKDLRRSPDSGTITGPAETFGLAPPEATIRVWSGEGSSGGPDRPPLAALEVGKTVRGSRYVRPSGSEGIEVIDPKLLGALDRPLKDWREHSLMPVTTFQVSRLRVRRDHLELVAERGGAGGRWRLTSPVSVPANGARIESTLAALASVRVAPEGQGFVADDVTDFKPFGLDEPAATVELTTTAAPGEPLILHVGKPVPDHPDRVYVRRGDQDDVAAVDGKFLAEIPRDSIAYRSQHVADIDPASVAEIRIEALQASFDLAREGAAWEVRSPTPARADASLVQSFLSQLEGLQTSEFLAPARVITPMLDPPAMRIKVWQAARVARDTARKPVDPSQPPALSLRLGRHDVLKKTIYGRLEGDDVILALPDTFLEVLPRNLLAFRDRGILSLNPGTVSRLTLERDGKTTILEPDRLSQAPNRWKMIAPVAAPADVRAVTQALALLSNLRAEDFAADSAGDGKAFGLDRPALVARWETESTEPAQAPSATKSSPGPGPSRGRLSIGKAVAGKPGSSYARLDGSPFVFTLGAAAVQALQAEFHDTQLMSFPPGTIRTLTLRLPDRALSFVRSPQPRGGPADWSPLPGTDVRGLDLSRFDELINQMGQLRTTRFYQYGGPIPPGTGLFDPRLVIELGTGEGKPAHVLRIGESLRDGLAFAATGTGVSGPVFFVPAPAWDALIQSATPAGELPDDVFAPR